MTVSNRRSGKKSLGARGPGGTSGSPGGCSECRPETTCICRQVIFVTNSEGRKGKPLRLLMEVKRGNDQRTLAGAYAATQSP